MKRASVSGHPGSGHSTPSTSYVMSSSAANPVHVSNDLHHPSQGLARQHQYKVNSGIINYDQQNHRSVQQPSHYDITTARGAAPPVTARAFGQQILTTTARQPSTGSSSKRNHLSVDNDLEERPTQQLITIDETVRPPLTRGNLNRIELWWQSNTLISRRKSPGRDVSPIKFEYRSKISWTLDRPSPPSDGRACLFIWCQSGWCEGIASIGSCHCSRFQGWSDVHFLWCSISPSFKCSNCCIDISSIDQCCQQEIAARPRFKSSSYFANYHPSNCFCNPAGAIEMHHLQRYADVLFYRT